jgi:HD-like signal output (HDOD) protein
MPYDCQKLVDTMKTLYSLPDSYQRVNEAVDNPKSSVNSIAKVIGMDQGLATRLLKLANSAFYGFPSRIETISSAVMIIGARELRDLALATAVIEVFKNVPSTLCDMKSFWRHSLACGLMARLLAVRRRESNPERFFVSGLLHDVGRLVLYQNLPDVSASIMKRAREETLLLVQAEREELGFDHARVGSLLLESWRLPPSLRDSVGHHHSFSTTLRYPVECALVHCADFIAGALSIGSSGECLVPQLDQTAWSLMSLAPNQLNPLVDDLERQYTEVERIFLN